MFEFTGLIFLFYVAFYTFLAGLFSATIYVMLLTLDDNKPTYQDRLATPGNPHTLTRIIIIIILMIII